MSDAAVKLILMGAGGHAKVLLDLIRACNMPLLGVCDPHLAQTGVPLWRGLKVMGDDTAIEAYSPAQVQLVNGLGGAGRRAMHDRCSAAGYRFATLVHPSALLGSGVQLGAGVQLMAGVIIQTDVAVGAGSIVNTAAQVDHDGIIGQHVHVAPGVVLAGEVTLGNGVFVGPGSIIGRGVQVGDDAVIGAGTTLLESLPAKARRLGNRPRA